MKSFLVSGLHPISTEFSEPEFKIDEQTSRNLGPNGGLHGSKRPSDAIKAAQNARNS